MSAPLLEVEDLRVRLRTPRGTADVVNGLSYTVGRGETVAVVGESGSGKSVSVLALLGLLPARVATVTGSARLDGEDLLTMPPERLREVRGPGVGMVFQDPMTSLNPVLTVGTQVTEVLRRHEGMGRRAARERAGELLRGAADAGSLNFHGNVEGDDIFRGTTDIVVCDGFVGNVALKTSEGLAAMLADFIRQEFTRSAFTRVTALVALPVLQRLKRRVDHRRYNGAALLGLRGLVFKSHGSADAFAFEQALNRAYDAARNGLLERVHARIHETLQATREASPAPSGGPAAVPAVATDIAQAA